MKKLFLLLAAAGLMVQVQAQNMDKSHRDKDEISKKDVPVAVVTAFNSSHPGMTDEDWTKDGTNYTAEIDLPDDRDMYITYDVTGKTVRTKEEMAAKDLPVGIMAYVKTNYNEDITRNAFKVTDGGGTLTYKVKMKGDHLIFDSSGNYIKTMKKEDKKRSL